ncbi:uncharacterized protein LOC125377577 [Haliotis rufescens]|uniref:uncharacterized protein LOC125377577 n=1 Tax=Haliotis rufescens TaxID=6454 RepID=UPI00201EB0DE|nr:uncharacterized protein LOC125377577 [Haliotis rufescens]
MLLCGYCGEDLPPGTKSVEGEKTYHEECINLNIPRGQEALDTFRNISTQSNVLCMAIHVNYIHGLAKENREQNKRKKEKRAIKTKELLKNVTALRNSNSGHLLIHFVGREKEDTFTGAFDEFADDKLQTLIQDGSLFTDVYTKRFLSDYAIDLDKLQKKQHGVLEETSGKLEKKIKEHQSQQEQLAKLDLKAKETLGEELFEEIRKILRQKLVETSQELERLKNIKSKVEKKLSVCVDKDTLKDTHQYKDFLVLYVEGGFYLTTSDSKTKIALDERIISPSDPTLIKFLKNRTQFKSVHPSGHTLEDLTKLHESRSVQFKGYFKGKETDEKIVGFMFDDHKLLEYVGAFTKNTEGGTYFLGIVEKEHFFNGSHYKSKFVEIQRVPISSQQNVAAKIKEGVSKGVLICDYDGNEANDELVDVFFIPSGDSGKHDADEKAPEHFIIQIHVKPVSGIVFYDKQGPQAYRVEGDTITTFSVKEWFHAVIENSVVRWEIYV